MDAAVPCGCGRRDDGVTAPIESPVYVRARGVVWRTAADRVLLQRVGGPPEQAAFELSGPVALVWLALDEPGTAADIAARLAEAGIDSDTTIQTDVTTLVQRGLLTVDAIPPTSTDAAGVDCADVG